MLSKSQRLNLKKSFNFVSSGKRVETSSMRVMMKLGENDQALIGIALTKKYFKKAVMRNRAKRLAATAIQSLYPRLNSHLNLVIMPKSQILERNVEQIINELSGIKDLYITH
jgi:ribonuclease P protein component